MKFIIALAFLVAGISALPQSEDANLKAERIVTGQIVDAINGASQSIKDAGLDPLIIKREARDYALPVPVIFNAAGFIEDVLSFGLSDIRVNRMSFNVITSRLNFDLELPHIHLSAGDASAEVTVFGEELAASASGSVDINSIRVVGQVQVNVGIISGISVRSVTIDLTLRSIYSFLKLNIQDHDLSNLVNTFIGETIPGTILAFRSDINKLIEIILFDIIDANL